MSMTTLAAGLVSGRPRNRAASATVVCDGGRQVLCLHGRVSENASSTTPCLVIKQDNNGDTFLITPTDGMRWLDEHAPVTQVLTRGIGAWAPDETGGPDNTPF
jgi:hypothetical protein